MKREPRCRAARADISARLDGEIDGSAARALDDHLEECEECRAHEMQLRRVRATLRVRPAEEVPDLTDAIMERVRSEGPRGRVHDERRARIRIAAVAAAAAAIVLGGALLPWAPDRPADIASAAEIVREVRAAARALDRYTATFDVIERGWHPEVPVRRFSASVSFRAPESLRLRIRDLTAYPTPSWPENDVDLVAGKNRWWIREPTACPTAALPECALQLRAEERAIAHREPFDGSSALPTDIVVPLETLASSGGFEILGEDRLAGHDAYRIALPYRQAVPLVRSLQPGGSWRALHPLDRVELWIDRDTWFPLGFDVIAGRSTDRDEWATQQMLLSDRPGEVVLRMRATSFAEPASFTSGTFATPRGGIVRAGGFAPAPGGSAFSGRSLAGLPLYAHGIAHGGRTIDAYSAGMTWLKVTSRQGRAPLVAYPAEEVRLATGFAYYQPAGESLRRRVDLYGANQHVWLESNLPRDRLLEVAASLGDGWRRLPKRVETGPDELRRLDPSSAYGAVDFASAPEFLPSGYRPAAAQVVTSRSGAKTLTVYYWRAEAEYDGFGIRVTQARGIELLRPSGENFIRGVQIDGVTGRWSIERGELEWIGRDGVYRAVAVPSFDLDTAAAIARGLP